MVEVLQWDFYMWGFFLIAKRFFFKKPPVKTAAKQTLCSSVFKYIWFQIPNNYSHWIKVDSNPIGAALQVSIGQRLTQNTKKTPQNSHTKFFLVSFFFKQIGRNKLPLGKKKNWHDLQSATKLLESMTNECMCV